MKRTQFLYNSALVLSLSMHAAHIHGSAEEELVASESTEPGSIDQSILAPIKKTILVPAQKAQPHAPNQDITNVVLHWNL